MRWIFALLVLICTLAALSSCTQQSSLAVPPYLPPGYYACIEITPEDLLKAYSANYGNLDQAQAMYTGQSFVFKKIRVAELMLADENTFVLLNIKFTALEPGAVARLKAGDTIDIVGTNCGMSPAYPGCLIFNDCVFIFIIE